MPSQPAFGLPSLYDPSIAADQAALDRQMAMAQMLRMQGAAPLDPGRQIGGMAYKISPFEALNKVAQVFVAGQMDKANDQGRADLAQKNLAALAGLLRGDSSGAAAAVPGGDDGLPIPPPSVASAAGVPPSPQVANAGQRAPGGFTIPNLLRASAIEQLGGSGMASAYAKNFETPEGVRALIAKGQDPTTVGNLETEKLTREVNMPTRLGEGYYGDAKGNIQPLPAAIPGSVNLRDPANPTGWRAVLVPGAQAATEANEGAKAMGQAAGTAYAGFTASGQPAPVQPLANVLRGSPPSTPSAPPAPEMRVSPAVQAERDDVRLKILRDELAQETDPKLRAAIQTEISAMGGKPAGAPSGAPAGQVFAAPPLGTENAQKGLDTSWEAVKAASREAQNTKSYLQGIVSAAEKGAIVGPQADRREFIAGLLQLAGIKEKVNENATTQTQLLDKYQNQIVARLGSGSMGTDAARAILESAYPGKKMNIEAIREAASNLQGAQDMAQAKARYLLKSATERNTTDYQRRELDFDQAADPRIWQMMSAKDPKKFVDSLDPAVAKQLLDSRRRLRELGVLQ